MVVVATTTTMMKYTQHKELVQRWTTITTLQVAY